MNRYIDTKWLEDNAKEYSLGYYDYDEYAVPLSALDSAPSIDIVRCGECKMWMSEHLCQWWSRYGTVETDADDFCSYGERTISKMEQVEDEPQRDCFLCKWLGEVDVCGRCRNRNLFCEAELQPRCPNCGKRGYIRSLESMGVKLKHFDEYKWKCTNCNKYFKEEPKDELQTERSSE